MSPTTGLAYPSDLPAWQRWQARRSRSGAARRLVRRLWPDAPARVVLTSCDADPAVLVVIETRSPTSVLALIAPILELGTDRVVVASPEPVTDLLPAAAWHVQDATEAELAETARRSRAVVSTGHYLRLGGIAYAAARPGVPFVTVQHGLLTPHAPPLAEGTTLLAWSEGDAAFWRSGRSDVRTEVVGSQLLWRAGSEAAERPARGGDLPGDASSRPVYLGQLHGAELPRPAMAASAEAFCLAEDAAYRPHPSERDRRSLAQHRRWEDAGITIDRSGRPLTGLRSPVVSAFSTGILEAAARGLPAWAHFTDPPAWLRDFWDRCGMSPWGDLPTPCPTLPATEPAAAVARVVADLADGR